MNSDDDSDEDGAEMVTLAELRDRLGLDEDLTEEEVLQLILPMLVRDRARGRVHVTDSAEDFTAADVVRTTEEGAPSLELYRRFVKANCTDCNASSSFRQRETFVGRPLSRPRKAGAMRHRIPNTQNGLESYSARAFCGKFSPDGEVYCSATQDGLIHLFHTEPWEEFQTIHGRNIGWSIIDIDHSPNKRFVAYSTWSDCVSLVNVKRSPEDRELHESLDFQPPRTNRGTCMFGIRFSPDNREILAGLSSGHVIVFDIEHNKPVVQATGHRDDVNTVCYLNPDLFATGSDDYLIKIWDRRVFAGRHTSPVGVLVGHHAGITCVAPHTSPHFLLSNSKDQSMKLWDVRQMAPSNTRAPRNRDIIDYRWQTHPVANHARRQKGDRSIMTYLGHTVSQTLIRCSFSPLHSTGHKYVMSGCSRGNIFIYDALTGQVVNKLSGHRSIVRDCSWHPFKPLIVTASWDHTSMQYHYHDSTLDVDTTPRPKPTKRRRFMPVPDLTGTSPDA